MTAVTIALPPGADPKFCDDDWQRDPSVPTGWYRCVWSKYFSDQLWVRAVATQYRDGTIDTNDEAPQVFLDNDSYSPSQAREMAAALTAAAELAEQWAGADR